MADGSGKMRITGPGDDHRGCLGRLLTTLLVLTAIALIAGLFMARTDGARSMTEDWLSKRLDLDVEVSRTRIGWPYDLVLEDVRSKGFDESAEPGFAAGEVRIGLRWKPRLRVVVRRGLLELRRDEAGGWAPSVFEAVGDVDLSEGATVSAVTQRFRHEASLWIEQSTFRRYAADGAVADEAEGVSFSVEPVEMPDEMIFYHRLSVDTLRAGGQPVGSIQQKWFASGSAPYLRLLPPREEASGQEPAAVPTPMMPEANKSEQVAPGPVAPPVDPVVPVETSRVGKARL